MPSKKISEISNSLTNTTLASADVFVVVDTDAGETKKITAGNLAMGTQDMWIPAAAMYPTATNGCTAVASAETTATRPDMRYLAFHQSTQQYAQFSVAMPKSWDEGTVTASFYWTHATAVAHRPNGVLAGPLLRPRRAHLQ